MKKLFTILAIAFAMSACSNSSEEKSAAAAPDSLKAAESPLMDAVNTADSASKIIHDSTHMMMDTTHKK